MHICICVMSSGLFYYFLGRLYFLAIDAAYPTSMHKRRHSITHLPISAVTIGLEETSITVPLLMQLH